jgi:hypothetical protein
VTVPRTERREFENAADRPAAWRKQDVPPVCCGEPMEPRLARARHRLGQTLFVAVWQCRICGRVAY